MPRNLYERVEAMFPVKDPLLRDRIRHEVLNARFHEKEAHIVAQAGSRGAVTIATNMAGRGTDINWAATSSSASTTSLATCRTGPKSRS